jgi:hypothetical protein
VPIVLYHGKKTWEYSTNIEDLVDAPRNLVANYFLKPFKLVDLSLIADETLRERTWLGAMELTLKYIFAKDILPYLRDIVLLLHQLEQAGAENFTEVVLRYILDRAEISNKDVFVTIVKQGLSPEVGEKIMTIAEQFKAEGVDEGFQKAIKAVSWLQGGADINMITNETGFSANQIELLKNLL